MNFRSTTFVIPINCSSGTNLRSLFNAFSSWFSIWVCVCVCVWFVLIICEFRSVLWVFRFYSVIVCAPHIGLFSVHEAKRLVLVFWENAYRMARQHVAIIYCSIRIENYLKATKRKNRESERVKRKMSMRLRKLQITFIQLFLYTIHRRRLSAASCENGTKRWFVYYIYIWTQALYKHPHFNFLFGNSLFHSFAMFG